MTHPALTLLSQLSIAPSALLCHFQPRHGRQGIAAHQPPLSAPPRPHPLLIIIPPPLPRGGFLRRSSDGAKPDFLSIYLFNYLSMSLTSVFFLTENLSACLLFSLDCCSISLGPLCEKPRQPAPPRVFIGNAQKEH